MLLVCGALALGVFLLNEILGENGYWQRRERRQRMQALLEEIETLEQKNQQLSKKIQALRDDPHTIEKLAREQLRLARPGEMVVTLPPEDSPSSKAGSRP